MDYTLAPPIRPNLPTLPGYVPPVVTDRPTAQDLNKLEQYSTQNVAAANSAIPLVYGRDRLFGKILALHIDEALGFMYVSFGFCEGEIDSFEKVFVDGVDVLSATGFLSFTGAAMNQYRGTTSQGVDPLLSGIITNYADTNPNTAYIVLKVPKGATQGFPRCEAIIKGKKVYDPSKDTTQNTLVPAGAGAHRINDKTTWEYTNVPALCFADMITQYALQSINWQSVVDTAAANSTIVGTGNNQETRREIGLSLLNPESVDSWVKAFRVYMGAYVTWEDGVYRLIPDKSEFGLTYALSFNGVDSKVQVVDTTTGGTLPLTLEVNYKMTQVPLSRYVIAGKKASCLGLDKGWVIYVNSAGKVVVAVTMNNGSLYTLTSTDALTLNNPVHIAVTIRNAANVTVEIFLVYTGLTQLTTGSGAAPADITNSLPLRFGENDGG